MIFIIIGHLIHGSFRSYVLEIGVGITVFVIVLLHLINRIFPMYKRQGFVAFLLSAIFPGAGFAYNGAYIRAWSTIALIVVILVTGLPRDMPGFHFISLIIVFFGQIIWSATDVQRSAAKMRLQELERVQNKIEGNYLRELKSYVANGHHVAVDTNFLMHFSDVLEKLLRETNTHLYLHPTVFGELEGLKGNKSRHVRMSAQRGFDMLELYQKVGRMQWTRKQQTGKNFKQADQRIVTGVLAEMQAGTKLVFASHDKGARILARSLSIPVVDAIE